MTAPEKKSTPTQPGPDDGGGLRFLLAILGLIALLIAAGVLTR